MDKYYFTKAYTNITFFIALNPFLRFMQLPFGEVDPLASILVLPVVVLLIMESKIRRTSSNIYFLLILVLVYSIFEIIRLDSYELDYTKYMFSLGIVLNPIIYFIFFTHYKDFISTFTFNFNIYLWTVVGIIQTLLPSYKIPVLDSLLSRGVLSYENLLSGRGVQSLSVEPAAVTYLIIFSIFYSISLLEESKISKRNFLLNIGCMSLLILLTRSATVATNLIAVFIIYYLLNFRFPNRVAMVKIISSIALLAAVVLLFFVLVFPFLESLEGNRVFDTYKFLVDYDFGGQNFLQFVMSFTQGLDGGRLASAVASLGTLITYPFGGGITGYETSFRSSWENLYGSELILKDTAARGSTYAGHIMTIMGIPGVLVLLLFHYYLWRSQVRERVDIPKYKIVSFFMGLFWIYVSSIPSLAIPWMILAI